MSHEPTTSWLYSWILLWNLLVHFIIHLCAPLHEEAHDSASHADVKRCHTDSSDDWADLGRRCDIAEQYILTTHTARREIFIRGAVVMGIKSQRWNRHVRHVSSQCKQGEGLWRRTSKCVKNEHQLYFNPYAADNTSTYICIKEGMGIHCYSSLRRSGFSPLLLQSQIV